MYAKHDQDCSTGGGGGVGGGSPSHGREIFEISCIKITFFAH